MRGFCTIAELIYQLARTFNTAGIGEGESREKQYGEAISRTKGHADMTKKETMRDTEQKKE